MKWIPRENRLKLISCKSQRRVSKTGNRLQCLRFFCKIWNSRHSHTLFFLTILSVIPFTRSYLFVIINFIKNFLNWNRMDSSFVCFWNAIYQSGTETLRLYTFHFLLSSLDIWTDCASPVGQIRYTTYVLC